MRASKSRQRLRRRAPGDPDRRKNEQVAAQIRSAGADFCLGARAVFFDYCAGSNHVLPTAGSARHSSGLSVQTFLRGIHVVDYTEAALKDVSGHVITLAKAEDLPSHTAKRYVERFEP